MPSIPLGTGPFPRAFAYARGFTESDVRTLLRRTAWSRVRRDVLVTAEDRAVAVADPATWHALQIKALLISLRRRHIAAAGTSSARIHGWDFHRQPKSGLVVCTDDPGVSGTHKNDYYLRVAPLPSGHVVMRHDVPVTSPARTLVDLGSTLPFTDSVVVAGSAMRRKHLTPAELESLLNTTDNRPGIEAARKALLFADPNTESVLESQSRASMFLGDVRIPQSQRVVVIKGETFRVDFSWDHLLPIEVYGEADGTEKLLGLNRMDTVRALREQERRHNMLVESGAEVIRWGSVEANNPALLAARIHAGFARATERARGRLG